MVHIDRLPTSKQNKSILKKLNKKYGENLEWFFTSACRDYRKIFYKKYRFDVDASYVKKTIRSKS